MATRLTGLTGATLPQVAGVCHECVWWQSRTAGRRVDKRRWIEKAETEFGAWGTVYYDDDGLVLGSMQYGVAPLFPRAYELPGGRLRLAHIRWTYIRGLYRRPGGTLHLSAGLGTTFVPFRFLARPEATELVLGGLDET